MYESFLNLKGRKVICEDSKKYFGRLSDILVNEDTNKMLGIVSRNDSLIYRHRFFDINSICCKDDVNIYVSGFGVKFVKVVPVFSNFKSCGSDIYRKEAVFSDGSYAGLIQNINFDFETGLISGFEVGASIIQDLLNGRLICPAQNTLKYLHGKLIIEKD